MKECTVALVDDHELVRNGLRAIVNEFKGYSVIFEALNGKDFIKQSKLHPIPDIVILDITMPVMDGYETAAWIRKNLPETKVLALSMLDNETAVIRMVKNGARGYVLKDSKPIHLQQALDAVRDHGFFMNEMVNMKMVNYLNGSMEHAKRENILENISEREAEFLVHAASELSYKEIAEEMKVSPRTVEGYRDSLFLKLDVKTRIGLVLFGLKHGMIDLNDK